jgi:hypothetical protein
MASTYGNNLRLNEMGTGDQSGTWGSVTNTNLELIAEAFSYQTEATFDSDGAKTATKGDGVSDKYRAMYIKVTCDGSTTLSATRTLNIAPNTVSKIFIIENATTGGQSISISQGSGANVIIANGTAKVVFTDGLGSGAAVYDGLDKVALSANVTIGGSTLASQLANFITASSTTTFTNKTFDADGTGNSLTNVEDANIKTSAAIDAAKIANGTISNTEFQYLNGVSSAIQTQINAKGTSNFSGSYNDLSSKPTIPTATSQLSNNSGFLTASNYSNSSTSGYIRFSNGLQMCWARVTISSWYPSWTFPLAFPNAVVSLSKHDERTTSSGDGSNYIYSVSTTGAVFLTSANPGNMRVMAIGY